MSQIEAGRALDALIAERVFGAKGGRVVYGWTDRKARREPLIAFDYERYERGSDLDSSWNTYADESGAKLDRGLSFARHYSTSIGDAWRVLGAMGGLVRVERKTPDQWFATVGGKTWWAETAPLAICRAALAATEQERGAPVAAPSNSED